MRKLIAYFCIALSLSTVSACATIPSGPNVTVVPARGKPFELFQQEDLLCRRWAEQRIGISPQEVINKDTTTGAMVGTAVGAGLGALAGAASGQAGGGALIGGAAGMLVGAASGADSGRISGYEAQQRYDSAYVQCMYAKDNHILGDSRWSRRYYYRSNVTLPPPPPPTNRSRSNEAIPPPPPGARPQTPPELLDN
jgi:hypothetical protein